MPFVEAFRQFQFRVMRENFANVHVSLIPQVIHSLAATLKVVIVCSYIYDVSIDGIMVPHELFFMPKCNKNG